MGLKEREKATYLKIKEGKLYRTSDKELKEPFGELEGKITNINTRTDEWEGQEIEKLVVTINDGEEDYVLSFSFDSSYTTSLVGFLKNADLSRVLSLVPVERPDQKDKTKTRRSILVKQDGKFLKQYYTKDDPHGVPPMVQTVVNKKKVWDKTAYLDFYMNVINEEIRPELSSDKPAPAPKKVTAASLVDELSSGSDDNNSEGEISDDLPF